MCDRLFKELKQRFHHKNVYNMSQMVSVLNVSPKVNVIRATSNFHHDWDKYFDRLYKRPAAGTINKNHIFRADKNDLAQLTTERIKGVDVKVQNLNTIKDTSSGGNKGARTRILKYGKVDLIKSLGLKPIKQVELYTKWRPLVPDEYKDSICPKPHESVFEMVKKDKAEKRTAKEVTKKKAQKKDAKKKEELKVKRFVHSIFCFD